MEDDQGKILEFPLLTDLKKGKDELNFVEFPLSILQHYAPKDCFELVREDTFFDENTGLHIPRKLTVTAPPKYGLPTPTSNDVLVGFLQLSRACNFENRRVLFTQYRLLKFLRWGHSKDDYRRLRFEIDKWAALSLKFENAWFDNDSKEWRNETFSVFDRVSAPGKGAAKSQSQQENGYSFVDWNEVVFKSFGAGHLRGLDYELYLSLKTPTAKVAQRYLGKHFWKKRSHRIPLKVFAHEKIGIDKKYTAPSKLIERLTPGLTELERHDFLTKQLKEERYPTPLGGEPEIVLVSGKSPKGGGKKRGDAYKVQPPENKVHRETRSAANSEAVAHRVLSGELILSKPEDLLSQLLAFGFEEKDAKWFLKNKPEALIRERIAYTKWKDERGKAGPKPKKFLAHTLHHPNRYNLEAEFVEWYAAQDTRVGTQTSPTQSEVVDSGQEDTPVEQNHQEEDALVTAYLAELADEHRRQVVETAWKNASSRELSFREKTNPAAISIQRSVLRRHVLPLLSAEEKATAA